MKVNGEVVWIEDGNGLCFEVVRKFNVRWKDEDHRTHGCALVLLSTNTGYLITGERRSDWRIVVGGGGYHDGIDACGAQQRKTCQRVQLRVVHGRGNR